MMPPLSFVTDRLAAVRPARQPYMVRRNYAYELKSSATFPLAAALGEGTFAGVVASKYFQAGPLLIAVITAAPMFGNILALLWSELAETRPKVRFINGLQVALVVVTAAVGLTWFLAPPYAGLAFAGLIIAARVLASGIITLRSAVWRMNYPRALRAQIIGRINGLYNTVLAAMVLLAAFALNAEPAVYAILYPVVAVISLLGVLQFSRIRVRGEGQLLRRARLIPTASECPPGDAGQHAVPSYATAARDRLAGSAVARLGLRIRDAFAVLAEDRAFRAYQFWQFVLGSSFMMMFPSLIDMVSSEMTDPSSQYVLAVLVVQFVPMVTSVIFLQVWAPVFDRTDILSFRVYVGVAALTAHTLILSGAVLNLLPLVAVGMFAVGVSFGGGQLAWQLGQNAFASKDDIGRYMGLHVMLTGLRGMFMPFLGVLLYKGLSWLVPSAGPDTASGGRWVFAVSVLLAATALVGYWRMRRDFAEEMADRDDEALPTEARAAVS
jgi:hypothetical protein